MHRLFWKLRDACLLTPEKAPSVNQIEVYVRDLRFGAPTTEEVLAVVMAVNARPVFILNSALPTEGFLSTRQYEILPETVKRLFVKKTIILPPR